jgi:hypothetical protein
MSMKPGAWGQPTLRRRRRRSPTVVVLAMTVVLVLAAGVLWLATRAGATDLGIRSSEPLPASIATAVRVAQANGDTVAVAVLDTRTGRYYGSLDAGALLPSESVVKVVIAADLLATKQMTGSTEALAYRMITQSDDAAADTLWGNVGGPAVISWVAKRYGITDLGQPSATWGWWGNTEFSARGLTELYAAIKVDPVVGPWLLNAMRHMSPTAADGTNQRFGLAAQTSAGAFKQGWGSDNDAADCEELNSTGLLDSDRYAVAVLVQRIPSESITALEPDIDSIAAAVAPDGIVVTGAAT